MFRLSLIQSFMIITHSLLIWAAENSLSLRSVSVVFRHGDRTPEKDPLEFYRTDIYRNESFYPIGLGGLTNNGKCREYNLGRFLRRRYDKFLGSTYIPDQVFASSTSLSRTRMSLLLVLAGLYPPRSGQVWRYGIRWQPTLVQHVPAEVESIFHPSICPIYKSELELVKNSLEYKVEQSLYHDLMKNLSVLTGNEIDDIRHVSDLYNTLAAEKAMNLRLPKWTASYFPNGPLHDGTVFSHKTMSFNTKLKKLNGGPFIRKFINDALNAKKNILHTPKIYLYGAHDTNVAAILFALNLWKNVIPAYSSAIIFELYEQSSIYFIKILYYKGIPAELEELKLSECSEFCQLEDFINLTKDVVPDDTFEACFGPPSNTLLIPKGEDPFQWIYNKLKTWYSL